jgi:hypothetical protein
VMTGASLHHFLALDSLPQRADDLFCLLHRSTRPLCSRGRVLA